jgi:hypothetical protein
MSSIRKQVLFRTLFIVFIVIPVVVFKTDNKYFKTLALVIIFYGCYQVIRIFGQLQQFFDDLYPPKSSRFDRGEKIHKLFSYGSRVLFFSAVCFNIAIAWWYRATIFVETLFWLSALFGFFIAIVVTIIVILKWPSVYHESTRRQTVHCGIFFGIIAFFPALAVFSNHFFSNNVVSCNPYTVEQKSTIGRYESTWIYITIENKLEKIHVTAALFDELKDNDKVNLCTQKGLLGYEFVYEIKKSD